jgi:hypothetical protein
MSESFWAVPIFRCVEPEPVVGPFDTYDDMLVKAREIRKEQRDDDALFWAMIKDGRLEIGSFVNYEICPEDDPGDTTTGGVHEPVDTP